MSKHKEYAVRLHWPDGSREIQEAGDKAHAERMLDTIYKGQHAVLVERKVSDWRYSGGLSDAHTP
jgi:hypothetical protein